MRGRAAKWRLFRYELRRWRDGRIPDVDEAVESPLRLTTDPQVAHRLLELVPDVPALTWGRMSRAAEMWIRTPRSRGRSPEVG